MSIELKIKSNHLSFEPKIIRREERKLGKKLKYLRSKGFHIPNKRSQEDQRSKWIKYRDIAAKKAYLQYHRSDVVKIEARATFLARTMIADKPRSFCEMTRRDDNPYFEDRLAKRVTNMVIKYGTSKYRNQSKENVRKLVDIWMKT